MMDILRQFADRCLRFKGEERPTIKEVAKGLEGMKVTAKHPWGKADFCSEETGSLRGSPNSDTHFVDVIADSVQLWVLHAAMAACKSS